MSSLVLRYVIQGEDKDKTHVHHIDFTPGSLQKKHTLVINSHPDDKYNLHQYQIEMTLNVKQTENKVLTKNKRKFNPESQEYEETPDIQSITLSQTIICII